ncbi:SDR family NAD(P)-dependent oxidoreductase [Diaphorobacter sp.]|uniref:SDR family oxidoreductase n=1 Tax=Diaphorobacter sp. TaxID=1934310 RepID=UPI0028ABC65C|nr:SDR family NAD(P)-dependent oxidoreductase [Diaphorobacter sp.]
MTPNDNHPKTAIVTGASGALGRVVVAQLVADGFRVAAVARDAHALSGVRDASGDALLTISADVTDSASCRAAVEQVQQQCGRVDVLCNIAGGFSMGSAVAADALAQFDQLMALNAGGVFRMVHCVAPGMLAQGAGSIINVGAQSALAGQAHMAAYAASKSAVIRLTEAFAAEFKPSGVRVNCVLPGIIDTPQNRKDMPQADVSKWTATEAIAKVIGHLASDESAAINGASIAV